MKLKWIVLGMAVGLVASLAPSCGPTAACGPGTCYGCCDAAGECVGGITQDSCGGNGVACVACAAGQVCVTGACSTPLSNDGVDAGADAGVDAGTVAPTNPLELTVAINPDPPRLGRNSLSVSVKGANQVPVTTATLSVNVYMPAMGHGSPETPVVTAQSDGTLRVDKVTFSMQGTWRVTLTATSGALSGTRQLFYTVN